MMKESELFCMYSVGKRETVELKEKQGHVQELCAAYGTIIGNYIRDADSRAG